MKITNFSLVKGISSKSWFFLFLIFLRNQKSTKTVNYFLSIH
ncbi:hypothetical protein HMPREF3228_01970 [Streptococcus mitis]|uniref:Uncharacterized protein n=1 Tax=Streptococcus mitis TaxID=28037 RepID=A0A133RRZ7_STRMT|nr:hypothetical protein HMPREF3228_01970 [Streptococcus mitis]